MREISTQTLEEGIRQGYKEGFLRKSVCHPFTRKNTGDNTPIIVHLDLVSGDRVIISGTVCTARDAAHRRIIELIEADKELPIPIEGQIIYYVGPSPAPPGRVIGAAGPTTSYRMDPFAPKLLELGLKGMIGKGVNGQKR